MIVAGLILTGVAALFHLYVFYLESVAWTGDRARAAFRTTEDEALVTKGLAFNQGFYNLFLTISVLIGTVLIVSGVTTVGATLVFVGAGSMVAAGLILLLSGGIQLRRAALIQLVPPLLGVICLAIGLSQ